MRAATRRAVAILLVGGALAGTGCGRSRPVASLSVEPASVSLPHPYAVPLRLRWNPTADLPGLEGTPHVFVHVLDGGRRLLRTFDHPLPEAWTPGRPQSYEVELYQSAIAEPLPAGAYEMTFGLYDDAGRRRWPLAVDGEGRIAVLAPPSPGTVRVAASILASGGAPAVGRWTVSASCSPQEVSVTGTELTWAAVPLAAAEGPACEIRFVPSASTGAISQPLCLEVLAWRPNSP